MTADQTIIYFSKGKLLRLLLFSIGFIAGGSWITFDQPEIDNAVFNNPIVKTIVGILGTLMGLFGIFITIKKLRDSRPGLIIDRTGFTNNTNPFSPGFTPWSDVDSITTTQVRKQKFIVIRLKDRSRSPINISPKSLLCNFDEMLLHFQTHFTINKSYTNKWDSDIDRQFPQP